MRESQPVNIFNAVSNKVEGFNIIQSLEYITEILLIAMSPKVYRYLTAW